MNTRRLIPILTLSGLLMIGGMAQAQTILPVNPNTGLPFASTVTVTLSTLDWLPTPLSVNATAAAVTITVNGLNSGDIPTIRLVCPGIGETLANGSPCPDAAGPGFIPAPGQVKTSAYPGVCTNFPSNLNPANPVPVDFTLSVNTLTSLDCGGTAVILVTTGFSGGPYTFVIPQDSDFDGIPDLWEAKFGPASGAGSLVVNTDPDNDGLSSFDEYRGVMLSETPPTTPFLHTRLHPNEPDLFVSLINPGCDVAATDSLLGGPSGTPTTYVAGPNPNDGRAIFANLNSLRPATAASDPPGPSRVHPVGYRAGAPDTHQEVTTGEGIDDYRFCRYDAATSQLVFDPALGDLDRLITANAVYPVSESPQTTLTPGALSGSSVTFTAGTSVFNRFQVGGEIIITGTGLTGRATITGWQSQTAVTATITQSFTLPGSATAFASGQWRLSVADQKWLRCVESTDTSSTTVFATGGWATANQPVSCAVYTKRIENRLKAPTTGLIDKGGIRAIRVQTFDVVTGTWVTLFAEGPSTNPPSNNLSRAEAIRRLVAEVIRFYATMEFTHMGKVRATLGACGPHDCAGTGSLVDKDFVQVIDKSTSGFNTFRIPTQANSTIRNEFRHRHP